MTLSKALACAALSLTLAAPLVATAAHAEDAMMTKHSMKKSMKKGSMAKKGSMMKEDSMHRESSDQ